jgi:hypothetical protein
MQTSDSRTASTIRRLVLRRFLMVLALCLCVGSPAHATAIGGFG